MSKQKYERFSHTKAKLYDFNSMILAGKPPTADKYPLTQQQYTSKLKEIRTLRKFEELFHKEYIKQQSKIDHSLSKSEQAVISKKQSPHQLCNRLKGMFVLRKRAELQSKLRSGSSEDESETDSPRTPPVKGVTYSPTRFEKQRQRDYRQEEQNKSKPLNFITTSTALATSGRLLHRTIVGGRPYTQLHSTASNCKIFNNQTLYSAILGANKVKLVGMRPANFSYFSVYVEEGNNSQLIKTVVRKRSGWKVVEMPGVANMVWSQFYRKTLDIKIRKGRQFQKSEEQKLQLTLQNFNNLSIVCEVSKKKIKDIEKNPNLISKEEYNREIEKLCPKSEHIHRKPSLQLGSNLYFYNHIPNNHFISDKKNLLRNMRALYEKRGKNIFEVMPFSIDISQSCEVQEIINELPEGVESEQYWIVKPGENSNRGRGIVVCKGLESAVQQVNSRLSKSAADATATISSKENIEDIKLRKQGQTVILQKYIQPLLYFKRKFDIRMYLLVTNINKKIRGYVYEEGYIRTSSKAFSMDTFNRFVHLTNDAIQTRSPDYGKFQEGNKVSWKKFQKWMEEEGHYQFWPQFNRDYRQMCRDILDSVRDTFTKKHYKYYSEHLLSIQKKVSILSYQKSATGEENEDGEQGERNKIYFEVFGLDFLIDQSLKTWLIEVNTNPAITTDCSRVVNSLIPRMIDNALAIAVEPFIKTPSLRNYDAIKFENNFQVIYDDEWT